MLPDRQPRAGPGRQNGDHKAKDIEKYQDTGIEPVAYGLRVHSSLYYTIYSNILYSIL